MSPKNNRIRKAVAYARFSSNNQREESIDAQLRAIYEFCEREGITLIDEYTDEAQSARSDGRDDFQVMINAILKGHIEVDAVLVWKFNRFARNKYDSAIYKKRLRDMGIRVISVTQKIDETPEGDMLEGFIEVIDEYYSANLALEVKRGMRENALNGKHTGGKKILGLSVDKDGYYYSNEQAPIVRRIFEMYADGIPKAAIVRTLNEEGYRNQYGRVFNTRTLYDMFLNEKYIGNFIYTHTKEEVIRIDGAIKNPIIDRALWERVQEQRAKIDKPKFRERKRYYYMTGKTVCGCCGSSFCGGSTKKSSKNTVEAYYQCSGKVKAKNGCKNGGLNKRYYEAEILNKIINTVLTPEMIKEISQRVYNQIEAERKSPKIPTDELKKQLSEVKAREADLVELLLDRVISREAGEIKQKALEAERRMIEKNIQKNNELENSHFLDIEKIEKYVNAFKAHLLTKKDDEHTFIKAVFDAFVEKIIVNENNIEVKIKVDLSAFDFTASGGMMKTAGAIRTVAPVKLQTELRRKRHNERLK